MNPTGPPFFEHYFLENPYPLCSTLAAAALLLVILSRRSLDTRLLVASLATASLAAGVYLLASRVETEREHLIRLIHQAVQCTASNPMDIATLQPMVEINASLTGPDDDSDQLTLTHDQMFALLANLDRDRVILGQGIDDVDAHTPQQGEGLTRIDLRTIIRTDVGDQLVKTRWLLQWSQAANGLWTISRIRWLKHPAPNALQPSHKAYP